MAALGFGIEDDNLELKRIEAEVTDNPDEFEAWEKLVRAAESQEGGLNRNSAPAAIEATRTIYDRFLAKFPLFFGYWKKYADLEFSIGGTEAAEMVYERGVASITNSVDLWTNYCGFKVETSHDSDVIRELFERGANCVGLDFLAHPFWDKYLEFEERLEAQQQIFAVLSRIVHIPMHQYARYFERFRTLSASRPIAELVPTDLLSRFRSEVAGGRSDAETERDLRGRIDQYYLDNFQKTQAETTKRWTYEQEIKRPYFHVTELDDPQLANWRKYLDFEESEGDFQRIVFLYERCLVAAAYYEEFWLRYTRWMLAAAGKDEEVRNIYQRASCLYCPIALPTIRLQYALFEEMHDRVDVARAIHEAILIAMPGHVQTITSLANLERRHSGLDAAIAVYRDHIDSQTSGVDMAAKGAFVAEWARLLWKIKGKSDEARQIYQKNAQTYLDVRTFWSSWLLFELEQPASEKHSEDERIRQVWNEIRKTSRLEPEVVKELSTYYMNYLMERGGSDAAKEYLALDRELHGPASIQNKSALNASKGGISSTANGLADRRGR